MKRTIDRRTFLARGAGVAGAAAAGLVAPAARAADAPPAVPPWMQVPGKPMSGYGQPSKFEEPVKRFLVQPYGPLSPGTGASRTPLHLLEGTITPNGLHFERHHNGVPDIDPALHELLIHGMVKRPLAFSLDTLMRYPMETHIYFIECSGNSGILNQAQPQQLTAGELNGLISCSEWTGVRLATLLAE